MISLGQIEKYGPLNVKPTKQSLQRKCVSVVGPLQLSPGDGSAGGTLTALHVTSY